MINTVAILHTVMLHVILWFNVVTTGNNKLIILSTTSSSRIFSRNYTINSKGFLFSEKNETWPFKLEKPFELFSYGWRTKL